MKTRKDNVDKLRAAGVMNIPPDTEILKELAKWKLNGNHFAEVSNKIKT